MLRLLAGVCPLFCESPLKVLSFDVTLEKQSNSFRVKRISNEPRSHVPTAFGSVCPPAY